MNNIIITISREYGSGGKEIGKIIAKKLGIKFYDKEIIDKAAEQSGLSSDFIQKEEQTFSNSILFNLATSSGQFGVGGTSLVDQIYISESKAIKEYAKDASCVFVGRCADYILRDYNCFNVFIYADHDYKVKRAVEFYKLDKRQAERQLKARDKTRARHYNYYCDNLWGERKNYHLLVNSATFGSEHTADMIIDAVREWQKK